MALRFYIDTSIWVDVYEDRTGHCGEPLGEFGTVLLSKILAEKSRIVVTDILLAELHVKFSDSQIKGIFSLFEKLIEPVKSSKDQHEEALRLASERDVPKGDAFHAILARDSDSILVTRDRHFKKLSDISRPFKPEDLI